MLTPDSQSATADVKKERARWQRILRVYGITKEDYSGLDTGSCPICLRTWSDTVQPVVDHRHSKRNPPTLGYVRGVVCRFCNKFRIGRLDDADLVGRIENYLRNAPTHLVVPEKKRKKKNGKK